MSRVHSMLARRHADAIYVPECKMGAAGTRTLDAWVLLPTWSPLTSIGYEVKVSRSDWTRDQKFMEYRPVCHLLMVAAEKGVVKPGELPEGVGLLEAVGNGDGGRLVMRVKPARVEPEPRALIKLMAHVLMWRVRVQHRNDHAETKEDRAARWRDFVDGRVAYRDIAWHASRKMRAQIDEANIAKVAAERRAEGLAKAETILRELGIPDIGDSLNVKFKIERALRERAPEVLHAADEATRALQEFCASVRRLMVGQ